jgi:hypothetical protein
VGVQAKAQKTENHVVSVDVQVREQKTEAEWSSQNMKSTKKRRKMALLSRESEEDVSVEVGRMTTTQMTAVVLVMGMLDPGVDEKEDANTETVDVMVAMMVESTETVLVIDKTADVMGVSTKKAAGIGETVAGITETAAVMAETTEKVAKMAVNIATVAGMKEINAMLVDEMEKTIATVVEGIDEAIVRVEEMAEITRTVVGMAEITGTVAEMAEITRTVVGMAEITGTAGMTADVMNVTTEMTRVEELIVMAEQDNAQVAEAVMMVTTLTIAITQEKVRVDKVKEKTEVIEAASTMTIVPKMNEETANKEVELGQKDGQAKVATQVPSGQRATSSKT